MNVKSHAHRFSLREWPQNAAERQAYVDPIFSTIATEYDFMTQALSFGMERRWKKRALSLLDHHSNAHLLDLATGTAAFPRLLALDGFQGRIVALDRNTTMLNLAKRKSPQDREIRWLQGDLRELPFKDGSFDYITMGYGLRYPTDVRQILTEIFRLLRPRGRFVCLDFGLPRDALYKRLCFAYLLVMGSFWGLLLHRKVDTYWHIVESLRAYPGQETVGKWLEGVGFCEVQLCEKLGGLVAILSGTRP
ncbi:MAG: ubiquinone/menaquinone biosynthesis methyltransferase [Candidatus Binatia bacterium]